VSVDGVQGGCERRADGRAPGPGAGRSPGIALRPPPSWGGVGGRAGRPRGGNRAGRCRTRQPRAPPRREPSALLTRRAFAG